MRESQLHAAYVGAGAHCMCTPGRSACRHSLGYFSIIALSVSDQCNHADSPVADAIGATF